MDAIKKFAGMVNSPKTKGAVHKGLTDAIDKIGTKAKSPETKDAVHKGLSIAAKNKGLVAGVCNGVFPGSGEVDRVILTAYNIPILKQAINLVVNNRIDAHVDIISKNAKSTLALAEAGFQSSNVNGKRGG